MVNTIKYIFSKIPKIIRWLSVSICIVPILTYIVIQFASDKPIELFTTNIIYLAIIVFVISLLGYIIGSFIAVRKLLKIRTEPVLSETGTSEKLKKILPHKETIIGTFETEFLSSDIRAKIILNENIKPNVDIFLDRLYEGAPFCTKCKRPLDKWNASYMADFAQIGYKCASCKTQIKGDWEDLRKSIKGEVRNNFDKYWMIYKNQIEELTNGKPEQFELPKY